MGAYATVLEQVSNEPALRVRRRPGSEASTTRHLPDVFLWPLRTLRNWWWGFTIRPIVKLFVETHINAKTTEIGRSLRQKRLRMATDSSEDVRKVDDLLRLVVYAESMVTGWSRFFAPLRFLSGLAMAVSWVLVAAYPQFRDLSTHLLALVLALVPLLMLIIYPVVVRFGFRWKRAVLAAWPSDSRMAVDTPSREGRAQPDVYELENQVYRDMRLKKHSEIPIDVILHPTPYWLLTVLVSIIMPLASAQIRGDIRPAAFIVITAFEIALILVFLVPIWRAVERYGKRKAAGLA